MTVGIRNPPEAGEAAERGQRTPTPPRNRSKRSAAPVFLSEPPNYFGLLRECCSFLDSQAWGRHRKKNRDREDGCSCRMTLFCRKSEMGDIYDSNSRPAGKTTELGLWDSSGLSPPPPECCAPPNRVCVVEGPSSHVLCIVLGWGPRFRNPSCRHQTDVCKEFHRKANTAEHEYKVE